MTDFCSNKKKCEFFLGTFSFPGVRSIIQDKSYFTSLLEGKEGQEYSYIEKVSFHVTIKNKKISHVGMTFSN